ncbi:MAG: hypothetical protein BAJALOKI1v1_970002 [Promethearchaeota archaeon]|nr:MAG: hypothetical protein BAJALOKI1v1_970002 [Candidatus Lokiarchaeota archaeon]
MIKRIFHPIGQGAYYSERFKDFNIVYDCGNFHDTKLGDKVVKQSFRRNDEIDILFISHFDKDHISKIKTLKDHIKKIHRVVMPLLDKEERILLANVYRALDFDDIVELVNNPKLFFGEKTNIIKVKETDNPNEPISREPELDENKKDEYNIDKDLIKDIVIPSGSKLITKFDWVYMPYNHKYNTRNKQLKEELKNEGFDVEKLKNNEDYTLHEIAKDISINPASIGRKFNKIYKKLDGTINENSMLLFSGPIISNHPKRIRRRIYQNTFFPFYYPVYYLNEIACIFTGDSDLTKILIKDIFQHYWNDVGTIQIPHHGSINNFNSEILEDKNYCCPISFGLNNNFGHPSSKIIADILSNHCCPFLVTEKTNSTYTEIM